MDIFITFSDESQIKELVDFNTEHTINFIDSNTKKGKRQAWLLKSHWAARLDPFILIKNGDKPIKAFYTEANKNVVNELINYLNKETN